MKRPARGGAPPVPSSSQSQLLPGLRSCSLPNAFSRRPSPASGRRCCRHAGGCCRTARSRTGRCRSRAPPPGRGRWRPGCGRGGRRRACASSSSRVGMNSSGSFQPAGRDGRAAASARRAPRRIALCDGLLCGRLPGGRRSGWRGRCRGRALARCGETDIAAPRRAGEQHALQRHGAQDAALQVREDRTQPPGAEAGRDRIEVGAGGAGRRGLGEMAAEAEQDANGVQQCGDAGGHGSGGGPIRLGIGVRRRTGRGGGVLHAALLTLLAACCQRNYRPVSVPGEFQHRLIPLRVRRWAVPVGRLLWCMGCCRASRPARPIEATTVGPHRWTWGGNAMDRTCPVCCPPRRAVQVHGLLPPRRRPIDVGPSGAEPLVRCAAVASRYRRAAQNWCMGFWPRAARRSPAAWRHRRGRTAGHGVFRRSTAGRVGPTVSALLIWCR